MKYFQDVYHSCPAVTCWNVSHCAVKHHFYSKNMPENSLKKVCKTKLNCLKMLKTFSINSSPNRFLTEKLFLLQCGLHEDTFNKKIVLCRTISTLEPNVHLPTTNCYLLAQKLTPHEMWYNHPCSRGAKQKLGWLVW